MSNDYELGINFLADGANFIRGKLQEMDYSVSETETLEQVSLKYFNLLKRIIIPYPREVLILIVCSCLLSMKKFRNNQVQNPKWRRFAAH
jgi:hypothetical protein